MARKYIQGRFKPNNPKKYKGNVHEIIYRSSWELKCLMVFDSHPDIIEYSSEETIIPYKSKVDGKMHRYYVDFLIKRKDDQGNIKTYLIEVKPFVQTQPPKKDTRITKAYAEKVKTYAVNVSKWDAAQEYCKKKGYEFQILTEKELNI